MRKLKYLILCILAHIVPIKKLRKKIKQKKNEIKLLLNFYESFPKKVFACKDLIYLIGDSHTNFFSGHENIDWKKIDNISENISNVQDLHPLFKTFHLGPCLAYNTNRLNTTSRVLEKTQYLIDNNFFPQKANLMVALGEIDCRVHVKKQAELQNKSVEQIIDDILQNFSQYLQMLKDKEFNVICWGPIASQKECAIDPAFPRYGTETERNKITEIYNHKLERLCQNLGIKYCSIFNDMIDDKYETKAEFLSRDGVHLSQSALTTVINSLHKYGIICVKSKEVRICK